jgi:hypothetical protein
MEILGLKKRGIFRAKRYMVALTLAFSSIIIFSGEILVGHMS